LILEPVLEVTYFYAFVALAQNRDGMAISKDTDKMEINPAFTIAAALTYTAQLVNVLSFFLNVRLPYKLLYRLIDVLRHKTNHLNLLWCFFL